MSVFLAYFGRPFAVFFYACIKLLRPARHKLTLISRCGNSTPLDFSLILHELSKQDRSLKVKIICSSPKSRKMRFAGNLRTTLVELWHIANSSALIVDGPTPSVSYFPQRRSLFVLQIWHTTAMVRRFAWQCPDFVDGQDSQLARALRRHAGYSKVLVASSLLQESYRHAFRIARSRIEVLPLPRVDALRNPDMNRIDFLMAENAELFSFALRVVYAPAPHEVSLAQEVQKERLEALVRAAKNHDALLMVKDESLEALQEGDDSLQVIDSPNLMLNPDFDDLDLLAMADHVISDYNDFIFEAAVAAKPLWFYFDEASDGIRAQGLNFDPQQYLPHLCFRDAAELMDALSSAPLPSAEQEELIAHFVQAPEKIGITSAKRIARLVLQSIQ